MCELLIKIVDYLNIVDSTQDRIGSYKKGMVIDVREDGAHWARMESRATWLAEGNLANKWHGKTAIVKIPGVPVSKAKELLSTQSEDDTGISQPTVGVVFRRRRWRLLHDSLPLVVTNALKNNGEVIVTKAQVKDFIERIRDGANYTGLD